MAAALHSPACALVPGSVTPRPRRAAYVASPQLQAQRLSRSGAVLPSAPQRAVRARHGVLVVAPRAAPLRRTVGASGPQLDLTEENVEQVLLDARVELKQMFDEQMGMTGSLPAAARRGTCASLTLPAPRQRTGTCTLVDLDGPFVTLRLMGRFWHPRGMVLARVGQFLQTRIPVRASNGRVLRLRT